VVIAFVKQRICHMANILNGSAYSQFEVRCMAAGEPEQASAQWNKASPFADVFHHCRPSLASASLVEDTVCSCWNSTSARRW
jgi:hypothetical protein